MSLFYSRLRVGRAIFALVPVFALFAFQIAPASAQPDGKTVTLELTAGGALLYYGVKLIIDNAAANSDGRVATDVVNTQSLADLRTRIIYATAYGDVSKYSPAIANALIPTKANAKTRRETYEILRTCWNMTIYAGSTADKKTDCTNWTFAFTAEMTYTFNNLGTMPSTTLAPAASWLATAVAAPLDAIDVGNAFGNAPSLEKQLTDASLKTYGIENALRVNAIALMGQSFLSMLQQPPGPRSHNRGSHIDSYDVLGAAADCITAATRDATKCITDIGTAETAAATAHRSRIACSFAGSYWLPSYSAIEAKPPTNKAGGGELGKASQATITAPAATAIITPDYGAVPGC